MARMTRVEQKEQTRTELIDTARRLFLADGYAATSLDAIAEAAGFSKGAVYSNFTDKPTLCRAVLEDIHDEKLGEIRTIIDEYARLSDQLDAFADWVRSTIGDVAWTMLEMEFAVISRRVPEQNDMIVALRIAARDALVDLLRSTLGNAADLLDADDAAGLPSITDLADLILSTGIGLGIQRAVDTDVSVEPGIAAMRAMFSFLESTD